MLQWGCDTRVLGLQETGLKAGQLTPGRLFICLRRRPALGWHRGVVPRPHQVAGGLLSNSGQYNRSMLIFAIRVARARSRLWGYRPNRTDDLGNFKPAILRNLKTSVDTKKQAGRRFPAPPGLAASSKNTAHGGVCAPQPSPAGDHPPAPLGPADLYLSGSQVAPPAARSKRTQGPAPARPR